MADVPEPKAHAADEDQGGSLIWLLSGLVSAAAWGVCFALGWKLAGLMFAVVLISVIIKEACDPFADAAQWVGETFHIPGSVRGATLDAIASSMPELFSGIFFVVVAVAALGDADQSARIAAGAEGYGSTIATCAGSAVYNMVLIPAFCALIISVYRPSRPTIDIEDEVILRDGMWFVSCQLLLILFLFQETMSWWMAVVFAGVYATYVLQLFRDAKAYRRRLEMVSTRLEALGQDAPTRQVVQSFRGEGILVAESLVDKARDHLRGEGEEEKDAPDHASALFGYWRILLSGRSATAILLVSTCVAAAACYYLVAVTRGTAEILHVPTFFVAVILAAAASSVPDTLLSIGSAMRGDDSGAVSNAFGSSIFDICIGLSIPLVVNSALTDWEPVNLLQDGKPIAGLVGLRILLAILTVITLVIIWHNRQLTRGKAIVLCGMYVVFIAYAVLGSLGILFN